MRPFLQPHRLTVRPGRWTRRERQREKGRRERERERERGSETAPRTQIGSICLVHKQSRTLGAARHAAGQKLAPTFELEGLLGARKHAHIHMQTETDVQECAITRFIRAVYTSTYKCRNTYTNRNNDSPDMIKHHQEGDMKHTALPAIRLQAISPQ